MNKRQSGVTLIELVITVTIISILAVIAVPSYQNQMRRSHRTDAMSALMRLAAEQEKFYFQNSRYATFAELGSPDTERDWYTLSVTANDANTFTAVATAKTTGPQIDDKPCRTFTITAAGLRTSTDSDNNASTSCWR
ncbi:MAG: prepilin-type N-terminal cleavage/methylation domain-containing protein [Gammaproteobacteria bacterium]|nr:prepilin-type N-terminal cleavage/methylation domain-containing protein [Gammaproteobacteria bacterium]NND59862.1 prepilin-type N-terminal cleavage/methylation domain-containing protein [Gammaproteobacteria bacterium]